MVSEEADPEPKSKYEEIGVQVSPSVCDVKLQCSGVSINSRSKGKMFQKIIYHHKHFLLISGVQVSFKPECRDVGIQCSLYCNTSISTPKKTYPSHIFSDSDFSDIEVDKQLPNESYAPSSESFESYGHYLLVYSIY